MDFEVRVGDEVKVYEQYHDVMAFIHSKMAHWNNFNPEIVLEVWVRKIPSHTETLGIMVEESVKTDEKIS